MEAELGRTGGCPKNSPGRELEVGFGDQNRPVVRTIVRGVRGHPRSCGRRDQAAMGLLARRGDARAKWWRLGEAEAFRVLKASCTVALGTSTPTSDDK